jgi:hypothetical protein
LDILDLVLHHTITTSNPISADVAHHTDFVKKNCEREGTGSTILKIVNQKG